MTVSARKELLALVFFVLALGLCDSTLRAHQEVSSAEGFCNAALGPHGDVYLVELRGTPRGMSIPWMVPPGPPDASGVAVVDIDLLSSLEASAAYVRLLAPYDETDRYYLIRGSGTASEKTIFEAGNVLWQSGQSYLVSVEERSGINLGLSRIRARLLEPYEVGPASDAGGLPAPPPLETHSPAESFWINRMVDAVSEENLREHICALSGETPVNLSTGPHTIMTRYSYHPDCRKAAEYLYSQFDDMGMDVVYEDYLGIPIRSMEFIDLEGYAVGDSGRIYHTEDGGDSWEKQVSGTLDDLGGSSFVAPSTCWVAVASGGGRLLNTTDGGSSWRVVSTGVVHPLYDVKFLDGQVGWTCGSGGIILKTSDGGSSWMTQTKGQAVRLYDIEFLSPLTGWTVGYGGDPYGSGTLSGKILHTSDGGQSWETQASVMDVRLYDACFVDSLKGWAVGQSGTILGTSDGGASWQTQNSRVTDYLYGVCFADSLKGWAVGSGGLVLFTTNGGKRWNVQRGAMSGMGASLYSASFISDTQGWVAGGTSLLRTVDGGISWSTLNQNIPDAWRNVVATFEGTTYPSSIYIVCGHYDSISRIPMVRAPGADDNASGTGLVLEAARILKDYGFESTIKFICFSGEELGPYGSTYYTESAHRRGERIEAALNFDMIAYGTPSAYLIGNGASYHLVRYCLAVGDDFVPQLPLVEVINDSWMFSDHASFWNKGYRALCGIELDNDINPYWHTKHDVIDHLDMHFAADVTRLAVASLASLAKLTETPVTVAAIKVVPNTLNLKSNGRYVTCHIELPQEFSLAGIDVSAIFFNGSVRAESEPFSVGDHDSNGLSDLMVKFDRQRVQEVLAEGDDVEVVVTGEANGFSFEGKDTIRVIGDEDDIREDAETISAADRTSNAYELSQNYPDPFNPRTVVRYRLPASSNVSLQVFDVRGKLVRTLVDGWRPAGKHMAVWNGESQTGVPVSSGVYFYRIRTVDFTCTRKMVLLR